MDPVFIPRGCVLSNTIAAHNPRLTLLEVVRHYLEVLLVVTKLSDPVHYYIHALAMEHARVCSCTLDHSPVGDLAA